MSRAFVKENDLEQAGIDIPERPISDEPNYVTPRGLNLLNQAINDLEKENLSISIYPNPFFENAHRCLFSARIQCVGSSRSGSAA